MRKYLVILACLGFLLFAGCNRCGMWDWYSPCDLVEGAGQEPCGNRCDGGGGACGGWTKYADYSDPCYPCSPQAGQVMSTEWAVPSVRCEPTEPDAATGPDAATVPEVAPEPVVETVIETPPAGG